MAHDPQPDQQPTSTPRSFVDFTVDQTPEEREHADRYMAEKEQRGWDWLRDAAIAGGATEAATTEVLDALRLNGARATHDEQPGRLLGGCLVPAYAAVRAMPPGSRHTEEPQWFGRADLRIGWRPTGRPAGQEA